LEAAAAMHRDVVVDAAVDVVVDAAVGSLLNLD
jgi:hypothetical protein